MYDRILVPVDGSAHAREVIPYAAGMAAVHGTALELLRIIEKESERADAEAEINEVAARFSAKTQCILARHDVAGAIRRASWQVGNTLIAMTSRGHSGLMEALLGSVAGRVIRAHSLPVLVYRPQGRPRPYAAPFKINRIVLPLDGSVLSAAMAPHAAALAAWLGARIVVVRVVPRDSERDPDIPASDVNEASFVASRAQELAREYNIEPSWEVLHGKPAEAISAFAREEPGTILAMSTHGREPMKEAFLGGITSHCLHGAAVPLLVQVYRH